MKFKFKKFECLNSEVARFNPKVLGKFSKQKIDLEISFKIKKSKNKTIEVFTHALWGYKIVKKGKKKEFDYYQLSHFDTLSSFELEKTLDADFITINFAQHLLAISFSSTRGYAYAKCEGKIYADLVLPLINVTEYTDNKMIDDDKYLLK